MVLLKQLFLFFHIITVCIGLGGALISDFTFIKAIKDNFLDKNELKFLNFLGNIVMLNLPLIYISGMLIFLLDERNYLENPRFLTKVLVVVILTINGIFVHKYLLPNMQSIINRDELKNKKTILFASGALSVTSWILALSLAIFKTPLLSISQYISIYLFALFIAFICSFLVLKRKV